MQIVRLDQYNGQDQSSIIEQAVAVLDKGGLVIFPTETVYGAGVDATNPEAVEKLLAYKSRREGKPLSIAVTDIVMAEQYVELNDQARALYAQFLPGPVTVVSESKGAVAPGVASEFNTLGVRIPDYRLLLELVRAFGKPITATSANASGAKRPYTIGDIFDNISNKQKNLIDLVLDAGELPKNEPSTVIDTTLSTPVTLRQGAVSVGDGKNADAEKNNSATVLTSHSEAETKSIAGRLLLKHWDAVSATGVVIGLDGDLGMGKTIFAKGSAEFLQIEETLTSPTYSYIEEYDFTRHQTSGKFYHLDMWKVDSEELFERLEIKSLLAPGNVVLIEWWSQVKPYLQQAISQLQMPLIQITFDDTTTNPELRNLTIRE